MEKKPQPLGRILLRRKLISQRDLDQALDAQKTQQKPLASTLIERGLVSEEDAVRALSEQYGIPGIDLSQVAIFLEHLIVPREVAEAHKILPLLVKEDSVFFAMADPSDKRVIDELEFVTGKKVYPYIALSSSIINTLAAAYDAKREGETHYLGPNVSKETLSKLGLTTRGKPSVPPPRPPEPIIDEQMRATADSAEMATGDFGLMEREDSAVTNLPLELQEQMATAATAIVGDGGLVLVVDDEDDIRKLVRRLLEGKGYRVIEADRGTVAIRMVRDHSPDVIILDAMLPEIHGFDIARRLKGSDKYGTIPIIMVSAVYRGWRIAEDLRQSYGIHAYIEKPFRIADLLSAVNQAYAARTGKGGTKSDAMSAEAEAELDAGVKAYKEDRLDDAIEHLKRGTTIDPLAFRLRFHLGLLYGKKGLIYEAIEQLEKAADLSPKHFPSLKNLAVLYEKAGFRHKAVEVWERCLHSAPDAETKAQIKEHLVGLIGG